MSTTNTEIPFDVQMAAKKLIGNLFPDNKGRVLICMLKIPGRTDCAPGLLNLRTLEGQEKVDRTAACIIEAQKRVGTDYPTFRRALIDEIGVQGL
jgi:hypothetical protein